MAGEILIGFISDYLMCVFMMSSLFTKKKKKKKKKKRYVSYLEVTVLDVGHILFFKFCKFYFRKTKKNYFLFIIIMRSRFFAILTLPFSFSFSTSTSFSFLVL